MAGTFNPQALIAQNRRPGHRHEQEYEAHFEGEPYFAYGATAEEAAANLWRYYENRDANPSEEQRHLNNRSAGIGAIVGLR